MDGDHTIDRCFEATESTLREVFYELGRQGVSLEGMLLKPNMVLSGKSADGRAGPEEIARKTIVCFNRTVPAAVPGIVFLSGGQNDDEATMNLNAINQRAALRGRPLAAQLLLRPWSPGSPPEGVGRTGVQCTTRPEGLPSSGIPRQRRQAGPI